ncbi:MAG: hypothetical protein RIT43_209 [Bacteroidota bacterium]|jgi:hypothetical protein
MKKLLVIFCAFSFALFGQTKKEETAWIGTQNRIENPGAESNSDGYPNKWNSDYYNRGEESNWVSNYGAMSHEWNHGDKMLGLPKNPGNNYFRLTVTRNDEQRKINLRQNILLDDVQSILKIDTVMASFKVSIGSVYYNPANCSFAEVKVLFKSANGKTLDSIYVRKTPAEFRDLDAGTPEAEERGFSVMHEFKTFENGMRVPVEATNAEVRVYCEFPCNKSVNEEDDASDSENANTFFFDNFFLGFYRK